jgi:hypothetical protein
MDFTVPIGLLIIIMIHLLTLTMVTKNGY